MIKGLTAAMVVMVILAGVLTAEILLEHVKPNAGHGWRALIFTSVVLLIFALVVHFDR